MVHHPADHLSMVHHSAKYTLKTTYMACTLHPVWQKGLGHVALELRAWLELDWCTTAHITGFEYIASSLVGGSLLIFTQGWKTWP